MRQILHLIDTTGPGGAETVYLSVLSGLDPHRFSSIPVVRGPGWVADSVESRGHVPMVIPSQRRYDIGYVIRLARMIRAEGVDLVHAHLVTSAVYGGLAAALAGIPCIATFHGAPDIAAGRLKCRLAGSLAHRLVFVSESLRRRAVVDGLVGERATAVIPNGIDTEGFHPGRAAELRRTFGAGADQILVGAVGNMRPLKDYPTFLRTAAALERLDPGRCRFVIVGATDSPLHTQLLDLASELDLDQKVQFAGFREDVADVLRALDVLLLTSSSEGFSLATVQAMATGLPVVATRSGGPEEILQDGVEGLLRPTGDSEALADAVRMVVQNPEMAREMGVKGRARVEAEYSLGAMLKAYEALYDQALEERGRA